MAKFGPKSIKFQKEQLLKLKSLGKGRVLDVSCGDGRVTRELLLKFFDKIDMFD